MLLVSALHYLISLLYPIFSWYTFDFQHLEFNKQMTNHLAFSRLLIVGFILLLYYANEQLVRFLNNYFGNNQQNLQQSAPPQSVQSLWESQLAYQDQQQFGQQQSSSTSLILTLYQILSRIFLTFILTLSCGNLLSYIPSWSSCFLFLFLTTCFIILILIIQSLSAKKLFLGIIDFLEIFFLIPLAQTIIVVVLYDTGMYGAGTITFNFAPINLFYFTFILSDGAQQDQKDINNKNIQKNNETIALFQLFGEQDSTRILVAIYIYIVLHLVKYSFSMHSIMPCIPLIVTTQQMFYVLKYYCSREFNFAKEQAKKAYILFACCYFITNIIL